MTEPVAREGLERVRRSWALTSTPGGTLVLNAFHRRRPRRAAPGPVVSAGWSDEPGTDLVVDPSTDPEGVEALDGCDAYVVLVADPVTGALDSYGPLVGTEALAEAERRRRDLDRGDLADVAVEVVRHHHRR